MDRITSSSTFNLTQWLFQRINNKNKVAFFSHFKNITYISLENEVRRTAAALSHHAILPRQRIIISLNDSIQQIILFLASIAIGACPIILNPRLKIHSLSYILEDSQATLLFIEADFLQPTQQIAATLKLKEPLTIISMEMINDFLKIEHSNWDNYHHSNFHEMAFMQYTSGTTGNPKGVIHSSQSILSSCQLFAKTHLNLQNQDILYSVSKMFFGYGMGNSLFFTLYFGASAIIDSRWPTTHIILENIRRFSPTVFFSTPTVYQNIMRDQKDSVFDKCLRLFFSAGAPLSEKLQQCWREIYQKPIYQGLGTTEMCHVFITNDEKNFNPGSIGKIINGYEYDLVKVPNHTLEDHNKKNFYRFGILRVKGPTMALGYWNETKATPSRFIDGWYHTGDIVSCDEDGFFYYHGREDDLFKVNGRWVVPSKIESHLKEKFSNIEEAILLPKDTEEGTISVLFIKGSFSEDHDTITMSILQELSKHFERHEIPKECIFIEKLPLNENGKISRKHLALTNYSLSSA